jgi:predicted phosphohydrolase
MVFITGDTHSEFKRFNLKNFPVQKSLTKDDIVIICGDFGGVWNDSDEERYWLNWLESKPFTTAFVSGNHENFDMLATFPIENWNGGTIQCVHPSVIHLMRGQVYTIAGKRFFTMGGATSHDIKDGILDPSAPNFKAQRKLLDRRRAFYRVNHESWWAEEMPSDEEYATARKALDSCGWDVDYIISHCAPTSVATVIGGSKCKPDRLTDFLQEVSERCRFSKWFFGHYHDNRSLLGRYELLYEQIMEVSV